MVNIQGELLLFFWNGEKKKEEKEENCLCKRSATTQNYQLAITQQKQDLSRFIYHIYTRLPLTGYRGEGGFAPPHNGHHGIEELGVPAVTCATIPRKFASFLLIMADRTHTKT